MANARGKAVDKTHLSIDNAEERGFLHRDYLAHCFRWSHVVKFLLQRQRYKTARILDIGCGKEMPLAKTLYSSRMAPEYYMGIDVNKLEMPEMFENSKWQPNFQGQTDICDTSPLSPNTHFNVITCFEVLEHIEPVHALRVLMKIKEYLHPHGVAFISTPDYDPHTGAAANHVNEMRMEALGFVMQSLGYTIENFWGTFASQKDYKDELEEWYPGLFERMNEYYDSNVLSCIFAPLFPFKSRNVLWQLSLDPVDSCHNFEPLDMVPSPWTSSDKWVDLDKWGWTEEELKNYVAA